MYNIFKLFKYVILGVVKKIHYFYMKLNGKIMDFFLLHLIFSMLQYTENVFKI